MRCDTSATDFATGVPACDVKAGTSRDVMSPLAGHRERTNGTSTPPSVKLNSGVAIRIQESFQRRRQEFFRHIDANTSRDVGDTVATDQRPSSVIPFGSHCDPTAAAATLSASFSASEVSARRPPAARLTDGDGHYASSVFANSYANISSLRASNDNMSAIRNDSASSMAARVGSAAERETPEPTRQLSADAEPVPSPPLIGQSSLPNGSNSSGLYVIQASSLVHDDEVSPLRYSSTTGYVRDGTSTVVPSIRPVTRQALVHVPPPTNGSFNGSLTGSTPTGEVHKTITYSPSTSFNMAGDHAGAVAFSGVLTDSSPTAAKSSGEIGVENDPNDISPYRNCDGQPIDLEDVLLLQQPILRPNSHFFCCFYKFHITAVAKVLSVVYAITYALLCVLSYKSQHAAAFLIAVLVFFSVGASTLYATFKWSKLCLIPFFLLQTMLLFYALVCVALFVYALIIGPPSYTFGEFHRHLDGTLNLNTNSWLTIILSGMIILTLLFCYSALLFWYEYQFIAEVDRFLKSIRRSSSQASRDDAQTQNGANFNSKSAF